MFVAGTGTGVAVVADWRLPTDRDLDESEPGRPHALDLWRLGRFCFGQHWRKVSRVALFEHGSKPSNKLAAERRAAFTDWLRETRPAKVYILPTPDSTMGGEAAALKGTHCWAALHAPDTLDAMRGTRWAYNEHTEVTAIFPHAKRIKELQRWCSARWLRGHELKTLHPRATETASEVSDRMAMLLDCMLSHEGALAVDLEFNPSTDVVTAIGLSDGIASVSVPFDTYTPRNSGSVERGLSAYTRVGPAILARVRRLLSAPRTKIAHNFVADIPRLVRKGFVVNGHVHDTFAAHAIAFPELRHGLQHAAASLLPVPPWKSLYRPSRLAKGITRDDSEFWTADPKALRQYNAKDAFFTWHLARVVLPHVGASIETPQTPRQKA